MGLITFFYSRPKAVCIKNATFAYYYIYNVRMELYPLKFKTEYKEKIWGGQKIHTLLGKNFAPLHNCGETWEISGLEPNSSEVINGFLAGNTLNELVEIYMGDMVGEKIFDRYGNTFPLLIKFIDALADLSVQVHPDDEYAAAHKLDSGKTEMWYVMDADPHARINVGFNKPLNKQQLFDSIQNGTLEEHLNYMPVKAGDTFYIPAGKVHAICKGTLIAEIQQCCDTTFRLYDYNRKDAQGKLRPLHIHEACEAMHFNTDFNTPVNYTPTLNRTVQLVRSPYFATNVLQFDTLVEKIYTDMDSFVIYICLEGHADIRYEGGEECLHQGECVLMPACLDEAVLVPEPHCKLLEVFIP